jgi:hypothetical protein
MLLQRRAGNRATARLGAAATLQRRVGFEWEVGTRRPWDVVETEAPQPVVQPEQSLGEEVPTQPSPDPVVPSGEQSSEDNDNELPAAHHYSVRPVPRKKKIHIGQTDWRIEADDTPGPLRSNIEYVTEPFDDTMAGIERLNVALSEINDTVEHLAGCPVREGPSRANDSYEEVRLSQLGNGKPPYHLTLIDDWETEEDLFVMPSQHRLSGSEDVPSDRLRLSGTEGSGRRGKMQATFGTSLGSLGWVLRTLGATGPTIGRHETSLAGAGFEAHPMFKLMSAAPNLADAVAERILRDGELGVDPVRLLRRAARLPVRRRACGALAGG